MGCGAEMRADRSSWSSLGRSGSSARGGDHARSSQCRALGEDNRLPTQARAFLENFAKRRIPITYQALAKALQILPPHSIRQVTEALERLMEEDAAADRPFIAALAIRGAWRPTRARVLRLRPTSRPVRGRSGRSGRMVVSRRRAKRGLRSLGRSARQLTTRTSCSPKLARPLAGAADCPDPHNHNGLSLSPEQRLSEVQERPRRPGNLHRGEGIRVHRRVPAAGPPARLHQYGRGGHAPLSLLRDAVPLQSSTDTARCRPAGQFRC